MNDQDYIRAGVELADGFRWLHRDQVEVPNLNGPALDPFDEQWFKDALAAQLVRQVDALKIQPFESGGVGQALVWESNHLWDKTEVRGPDRTMNTIKAIVDSKVLATADDSPT